MPASTWPLGTTVPWWLLTNYPDRNDVLTVLDGTVLLAYVGVTAIVYGMGAGLCVALGTRAAGTWSWPRFHHLAQALIPMAGCGVFLGLSAMTVSLLRADGITLPDVATVRAMLLAGAVFWSAWLGWRIGGQWVRGGRLAVLTGFVALGACVGASAWILLFWIW
ncbi:MAG: hypothetical protein QM753_11125 [Thermomicrobiales bacterium]